jgi:hypothetical protein
MAEMKRWILGAVLAAAAAAGCKNAPSEDQCKQLLDHLVDLEFKKAGAAGGDVARADLAKQKQAVSEAKLTEFLEACTKRMAKTRVECALATSDLEGVGRCDEVK